MHPLIFCLFQLYGVVDRVEGDLAVVEWRVDAFADLPLALLPPEVGEGDRLTVTLTATDHGPWLALDEHRLARLGGGSVPPLLVPPETSLHVGGRYDLRVELEPAAD